MNWASFKLGTPMGLLGALMAISAFIGVKGDEFSVFDINQLSRMLSLGVAGFIQAFVAFLVGLKTREPWDGIEYRRNDPTVKQEEKETAK